MARAYDIYFDEPRLKLTFVGRMGVRITEYIAHFFLVAAAASFLSTDVRELQILGVILALFLADRVLHWQDADKSLFELPAAGAINSAAYLAPRARSAIEAAYQKNALTGHGFFLEVALQLMKQAPVREGLVRLSVDPAAFIHKAEELISANPERLTKDERYAQATELVGYAFRIAHEAGHDAILVSDLFAAMPLVSHPLVRRLSVLFGLEAGDLVRACILSARRSRRTRLSRVPARIGSFLTEAYPSRRHRVMNRAWTSRVTPVLDAYSMDLTDLARRGAIGALVGHESEYERMVEILSRSTNPNALLVGDVGIGKAAIVSHLASEIVRDRVPKALIDKRLVELNLSGLLAGAPPAELDARMKAFVEEIDVAGNVILFIPELHNLVRTSGEGSVSAADALLPILRDNRFPVVGASYPLEFKKYLGERSDVMGIFDVIHVEEITEEEACTLVSYASARLEELSSIVVTFAAVRLSVALAKKYLHEKPLPGSALELLKDALARAEKQGEGTLEAHMVEEALEAKTHVPVHAAEDAEAESLLHMEERIHAQFVDQDEAVRAVSTALREYRSGLTRAGGPIASFLFVGPTGVGKTELARVVASLEFGSHELFTRLDMSEYQDATRIMELIGSSDGKTLGRLTEAVREKPYSLVLLDEFEKAHHDILNIFLTILDDGKITDGLGRAIDFQNTVIVATSNAHSDIMIEALRKGEGMAGISEYLKEKLSDVFKPELLNRFSRIVVFRDLEPPELMQIADLRLKEFARTLKEKGITFTYGEDVLRLAASLGYDPKFGARPLRRVIEEKFRSPFAEMILKKEVVRGSAVRAEARGKEIVFGVERA